MIVKTSELFSEKIWIHNDVNNSCCSQNSSSRHGYLEQLIGGVKS